jgi:hypothetical protein
MRKPGWMAALAAALTATPALAALAVALTATPALAADLRDQLRAEMNAKRAAIFAQADVDGDGALTPDEFATFHTLMKNAMEADRFTRADADGNGKVTLEELQAAGPHHFPGGPCGR